jgi:hypothetical protein
MNITAARRQAMETAWVRENRSLSRQNRETASMIMRNKAAVVRSRFFVSGDPNRKLVSAPWLGEAVVIVTAIDVVPVPLSGTELGETTHVEKVGAPLQVSATVWLKPFSGVSARE